MYQAYRNMASTLTAADAIAQLKKTLNLSDKRSEKLISIIKDDSGKVSKQSLDKLVLDSNIAANKIKSDFAKADPEKTGTVSFDDANIIISKYFPGLPEHTRKAIVHNYDRDNNQKVNFAELTEFYVISYLKKAYMEKRFNELDVNGDGVLEREELLDLMIDELCLWPLEANCVIDDCDKNKDGYIDKQEFLQMWCNMFS